MSKVKCDVCGEPVEDRVEEWDKHNLANYVRHVFLSTPNDESRIRIIQNYVDLKG